MAKVCFDGVVGIERVRLAMCAALALFFFVSCTDSSSNSSDDFSNEEDLCTEQIEGVTQMRGESEYICSNGFWKIVVDSTKKELFVKDSIKDTDSLDFVDTTKKNDTLVTDTAKKTDTIVVKDSIKKDTIPEKIVLKETNVNASGVVEYGRFNTKATIVAEELDSSLNKTGVSFTGALSTKDGSFNFKNATMTGPYMLITVMGPSSNMALGSSFRSNDTLFVIARVQDSVHVNINALSFLVTERMTALLKEDETITFTSALKTAIEDVWVSLGYETLKEEDPGKASIADGKETGSTLLALTLLFQSMASDKDFNLHKIAEDIADGKAIDSVGIAKMADWVFNEDMSDAFEEVRENVEKAGFSDIPEFESVLGNFYHNNLGLETCDESKNGKIAFVTKKYSDYYAANYSDASVTKERFLCENGVWRVALDKEKDTYEFEAGVEGEKRQGLVNRDFVYSYTGTSWRLVSSLAESDAFFVQQSNITDFIDIKEVYESIKDDERVIFLLRHGERDKDKTSKNDPLSTNGYEECVNTGKKLTKFSEPFRLGASEFYRAQQTVIGMAEGRGQNTEISDTFAFLNDDWYMIDRGEVSQVEGKAGGGWEAIGRYVYAGEYTNAYYNLEDRSAKLIDTLLTTYADTPERFILLSSHDKLMVPFVAYCSDRRINMDVKGGGTWINYLAGIAIIWDKSGNRRYVAFKGLESAYFRGW